MVDRVSLELRVRETGRAVAVTAAICVDLMENLDTRVVAAGRQRMEDLLQEFRAQAGSADGACRRPR